MAESHDSNGCSALDAFTKTVDRLAYMLQMPLMQPVPALGEKHALHKALGEAAYLGWLMDISAAQAGKQNDTNLNDLETEEINEYLKTALGTIISTIKTIDGSPVYRKARPFGPPEVLEECIWFLEERIPSHPDLITEAALFLRRKSEDLKALVRQGRQHGDAWSHLSFLVRCYWRSLIYMRQLCKFLCR